MYPTEKANYKLPELQPRRGRSSKTGCYLITADLSQKESYEFKGADGNIFKLYTPQEQTANLKDKLPSKATIVGCFGDVDFKEGDEIIIDHFVLLNHDESSNHIYTGPDGVKYWRVDSHDVFAAIIDGKIVPNSDFLICEYCDDVFINTFLEVPDMLKGKRQDVARVFYSKHPDFRKGDLILVEDYALYQIDLDGRAYAKVDLSMDDVVAKLDNAKWKRPERIRMDLSRIEELD